MDYRDWMKTNSIDSLEQSEPDLLEGVIEFRAKRGDLTALYYLHRRDLLDARYDVMPDRPPEAR